jgi:hypothetical protein
VVSVTIWRLRPLTFLSASYPRGPPLWVVLTDWLSMTPDVKAYIAHDSIMSDFRSINE